MNHEKNYVGFSKDASSSMSGLRNAAVADYNATISAIKDASTRHTQDTIVFVNRFDSRVTREIVNSNPHVLKPLASWQCGGYTALYDGIGDLIEQMEAVPDASNPNVSFLVFATTDGDENSSSKYSAYSLAAKIRSLQDTGRWTFVLRVPKGRKASVSNLGIPDGNIQEWETTVEGMAASTKATAVAMEGYYATRATGQKGSNTFYTGTANVDTSKLADISSKTSLYVVDDAHNGSQIRDFILTKRMEYLIGAAFYQLTKTEARVSPSKLILIRERSTGKVYAGKEARQMIGLDTVNNARLHPNHGGGGYDIFIQSESVNRKLVAGTGVLYWAEKGRPVTQADLDKYAGQGKPSVPAVPVLAEAPATGRPTPSPVKTSYPKVATPVKPQPIVPSDGGRVRYHTAPIGAQFYPNREVARYQAELANKRQYDAGPTAAKGQRYYVF